MQTKFNASSDRQEKFSLQSSLIYFVWNSGAAPLGGEAHLEVGTSFVGDGAPIEITAKTAAGKSVGKITDKIRNNKFVGSMPIPDNLRLGDLVYFKVKLSSHGLEGESNRIPVVLPIIVSDLSWSATEARRGDTLTLKAKVKNVINGTPAKVTIYESDQDGAHDKICELETTVQDEKIELQWEYQYHEDTDEIPSEQELQQYGRSYNPPEYFFTVKLENDEYGRDQSSGLLLFKDWIEIELRDDEGRVVPNQHYKIALPDGTEREGDLDDQGKVRIEDVPPGQFTITYPGAVTAVNQEEFTDPNTEGELSDQDLLVADQAEIDSDPQPTAGDTEEATPSSEAEDDEQQ